MNQSIITPKEGYIDKDNYLVVDFNSAVDAAYYAESELVDMTDFLYIAPCCCENKCGKWNLVIGPFKTSVHAEIFACGKQVDIIE